MTALVPAVIFATSGRLAAADDPLVSIRLTLESARTTLFAKLDAAKAHSDDAYDIVNRVDAELGTLDSVRARTDADYVAERALAANLDAAWIGAVTTGTCPPFTFAPGARESCFTSHTDATLQPLGLYIPAHVHAGTPAPLVIVLRGRGQTESDLLARAELRELADARGAILALPYARGRALYDRAATQDVLDALDAAQHAYAIDTRRVYLAGFSMGGIAAFHVAGAAPDRFAALLTVVGALDGEDRAAIRTFGEKPVYVVNGENDEVIPAERGRASVRYLRSAGIPARYYEQPGGTHSLHAMLPALRHAWDDMFGGIRTIPNDGLSAPATGATGAPQTAPTPGHTQPS